MISGRLSRFRPLSFVTVLTAATATATAAFCSNRRTRQAHAAGLPLAVDMD
jgi:hypothetical protein